MVSINSIIVKKFITVGIWNPTIQDPRTFEIKILNGSGLKVSAYIYVTDRACACLKSVLRLGVDKDHRTSSWELILYQTCTTIGMSWRQELKIVYSGDLNYEFDKLMFEVYQMNLTMFTLNFLVIHCCGCSQIKKVWQNENGP